MPPLKRGRVLTWGLVKEGSRKGEQERGASGVDGLPYPAYLDWRKRQGPTPALKKNLRHGSSPLVRPERVEFQKRAKEW